MQKIKANLIRRENINKRKVTTSRKKEYNDIRPNL